MFFHAETDSETSSIASNDQLKLMGDEEVLSESEEAAGASTNATQEVLLAKVDELKEAIIDWKKSAPKLDLSEKDWANDWNLSGGGGNALHGSGKKHSFIEADEFLITEGKSEWDGMIKEHIEEWEVHKPQVRELFEIWGTMHDRLTTVNTRSQTEEQQEMVKGINEDLTKWFSDHEELVEEDPWILKERLYEGKAFIDLSEDEQQAIWYGPDGASGKTKDLETVGTTKSGFKHFMQRGGIDTQLMQAVCGVQFYHEYAKALRQASLCEIWIFGLQVYVTYLNFDTILAVNRPYGHNPENLLAAASVTLGLMTKLKNFVGAYRVNMKIWNPSWQPLEIMKVDVMATVVKVLNYVLTVWYPYTMVDYAATIYRAVVIDTPYNNFWSLFSMDLVNQFETDKNKADAWFWEKEFWTIRYDEESPLFAGKPGHLRSLGSLLIVFALQITAYIAIKRVVMRRVKFIGNKSTTAYVKVSKPNAGKTELVLRGDIPWKATMEGLRSYLFYQICARLSFVDFAKSLGLAINMFYLLDSLYWLSYLVKEVVGHIQDFTTSEETKKAKEEAMKKKKKEDKNKTTLEKSVDTCHKTWESYAVFSYCFCVYGSKAFDPRNDFTC
jgi:hypothetical protein